jgi:hypothetical protein
MLGRKEHSKTGGTSMAVSSGIQESFRINSRELKCICGVCRKLDAGYVW